MSAIRPDNSNELFSLAAAFVNNTTRHLFLTGKAGTGKTTFLKHIKETSRKHCVIAAPTGVAAINAGGTTLHSLFQLPFGPYIPVNSGNEGNAELIDQHNLLKQLRLSNVKRELLREMELLIIDEVSMVRADMIDAIDTILRSVRKKNHIPFGGVQVLYIGDLYQLPPVVANEEWAILKNHYKSPFFFHARAIEQSRPLYIELKKIYRQNEQRFIDILNRIRNNEALPEDLEELNQRMLSPGDLATSLSDTITLTTHNKKADAINAAELEKLPGKLYLFEGVIENDFPEFALPTEQVLTLKQGAQLMFIKNDTGENRRYFNGKLAVISSISDDEIKVIPAGETRELLLEKETWNNIRYVYNKEKNSIEEEVLGSFTQYPVRLAWAITIHKSQGLTFEKAVIDAGQAFAPGQVYVALSRCTSLEGLALSSRIFSSAIQTNPLVVEFASKEAASDELSRVLDEEKKQYSISQLYRLFDWTKPETAIEELKTLVNQKDPDNKLSPESLLNQLSLSVEEQKLVAEKFVLQLKRFFIESPGSESAALLAGRITKAIQWFTGSLYNQLILPLREHIAALEGKSRQRTYMSLLLDTEAVFWNKLNQLQQAGFPEFGYSAMGILYSKESLPVLELPEKKKKLPKGSSQQETLALFLSGKSIPDIVAERKLAPSTIESHLAQFVLSGELEPEQLISAEKIKIITEVLDLSAPEEGTTAVKQKLGDAFSYNDIRIVINFRKRSKVEE